MGSGDRRKATLQLLIGNGMNFALGDFVSVLADSMIASAVVFFIAKYAKKI